MKTCGYIRFAILFLIFVSCSHHSNHHKSKISSSPEIVMSPGMIIVAVTPEGTIRIEATGIYKRKYTWNGKSREFELHPRNKRWGGNKGIYRPYGNMQMHAVLGEGQQHFCDINELYDWFNYYRIYTSDGLLIRWKEEKRESDGFVALDVDLIQVYINGEKPVNLKGSSDDKVSISFIGTPVYPGPSGYKASCPKQINGRWYTGRAIDACHDDSLSFRYIEKTITESEPYAIYEDELCYRGKKNSLYNAFTACTDLEGNVISAGSYYGPFP